MKKKVHKNSNEAYDTLIKGMADKTQDEVILQWMPTIQPCTCRQMSIATGFELTSVRRSMHYMENPQDGGPKLLDSYDAKCKIKNTTVKHFSLVKKVVKKVKAVPVINNQISIFQTR